MKKLNSLYKQLSEYRRGFLSGIGCIFILISVFTIAWSRFKENDKRLVLVLNKNLGQFQEIDKKDIEIKKIPAPYQPKGAVPIQDMGLISQKRIRVPLPKGAILRWHDLANENERTESVSSTIPPGYRALNINFNQGKDLEKLLKPGDLIDIIGTFALNQNDDHNQKLTRTLFQSIRILKTKPRLTLLLTPSQAELLLFSQSMGSLVPILRNQKDQQEIKSIPEHEFRQFIGLKSKGIIRKQTARSSPGPQILKIPAKGPQP